MMNNPNFSWPETVPERILNALEGFLNTASQPHAYLLIGNQTDELANSLATRITEKTFPNVDTVQFDAADGEGIEGIRDVIRLASLMPVSAQRKAIVIRNLDKANHQMLNALLKSLEEPPSHSVFVLTSNAPLISTIMSRCQVLKLPNSTNAIENSEDVIEALNLLQTNQKAGVAERMALINTLANMDDEVLSQVIEQWMNRQVAELKTSPGRFKAVRITMETLASLRNNFNKKMVLQNFVMNL